MADLVIDTSGAGPENVNRSIGLLRKRGTFLYLTRKGAVLNFDIDRLVGMQLSLRGSQGSQLPGGRIGAQDHGVGPISA